MRIRNEQPSDLKTIYRILSSAFPAEEEAKLVDGLRKNAIPTISLVAESKDGLIGHIFFSPVSIDGHPLLKIMGLAPMAVLPEHQNTGIGSALVAEGLSQCKALNTGAVVVLGHSAYYPRFNFAPAIQFGLESEYDVADDVFMAQELVKNYLNEVTGTIKYHQEFHKLS
ncbi:MAG: N-acetyltransferase [Gammaproteobacteria bacterium]|jgi:putative acetyltransferase|nr:N-acetyltransferase [Gammaproteobacteria bacterium]MBT3860798.1 N-acetyltransferase [Gammaproteobacteria bacterium]MBT3986947.1 N-acetyltransferase [Gammaproteobacteria bacterium]MBT4255049.1 N-acetyltransferase [Gammaproteobacteria bacterium]MBT4582072.1 N-acetyltransferase [Gammaproteobacteria bacterium]